MIYCTCVQTPSLDPLGISTELQPPFYIMFYNLTELFGCDSVLHLFLTITLPRCITNSTKVYKDSDEHVFTAGEPDDRYASLSPSNSMTIGMPHSRPLTLSALPLFYLIYPFLSTHLFQFLSFFLFNHLSSVTLCISVYAAL